MKYSALIHTLKSKIPIFLLPWLALQPLWRGHVPWQGDGLLHFYRLAALEQAVARGDWFPRWVPNLGYGYGFPLFNYYAPLSYYVGLPFHWLGLSLGTSTAVSYALALLLLTAATYQLGRAWAGEQAGLTAAAALTYAPYVLLNLHHRAALAELWGLAWLMACLWLTQRTAACPRRWPWLTLSYAALLLSHNITALIGTPVLLAAVLWQTAAQPTPLRQHLTLPLGALLLGLLTAAFFWLPALLETGYVQIGRVTDSSNFSYANHFLTLGELFSPPPTADPLLVNPNLPRALGWGGLILVAYGLVRRFATRRSTSAGRFSPTTLAALLFLFALGMTLPLSQPVWDRVPLLPLVQFPWRFLGPAAVGLALLGGQLVASESEDGRLLPHLLLGLLLLSALPYLFPSAPPPLPPTADSAALIAFEAQTGWLGTTSAGDYLPTAVAQLPPPNTAAPFTATRTADTLTISQFYFPGWQLWVDGHQQPLTASAPYGLLQATLPAGPHQIELRFGNTPLRTAANWLSLVAWLVLVSLSAGQLVSQSAPSAPLPLRSSAPLLPCTLLLLLILLKTTWLDTAQTPFRRTQLVGQQVVGSTPTAVDFAHEIRLLGYHLPPTPQPADQPVAITLYWQAIQPTAELSIGLHLLDENGVRYGQSDHQHPAGLPITRWLPTQYGRDVYALLPVVGTPPGDYTVELVVYGTADGRQRELLNEAGLPMGVAVPLGRVTLAPPTAWPSTAALAIPHPLPAPGVAQGVPLLGYDALPATAAPGDPFLLTLFWDVPLTAAAPLTLTLRGADGTAVATWPLGTPRPSRDTRPFVLPVTADGQPLAHGDYQFYVNETPLAPLTLTPPSYLLTPPPVAVRLGAAVGDVATLVGATWDPSAPNGPWQVELVWQAQQTADRPYTVFVQLLGPDGRPIAQSDHPPQHLTQPRPTTGWLPGEYFQDHHTLTLPSPPPAGPYTLITGLYDPATGQRLPTPMGDFIEVTRSD